VKLKREKTEVMKMGMREFPLIDTDAKAVPLDHDVSLGTMKPRRNILTV
jgi:hypothetical protein